NRNRSARCASISAADNVPSRAAASSIASGSPSSFRQIRSATATGATPLAVPPRAADPRSKNNRTAAACPASRACAVSGGRSSGRTGQVTSPGIPSGFAAGRQDPQPRRGAQQRAGQPGAGIQQMLAVIQYQQQLRGPQPVDQRFQHNEPVFPICLPHITKLGFEPYRSEVVSC